MPAEKDFVCPICGRVVREVAMPVADDSRGVETAADAMSDVPLAGAPGCEEGHPPVQMVPEGSV